MKFKQYINEAKTKIPDSSPLGVKVPNDFSLARAETIGGMNHVMPVFKEKNVASIPGNRWGLSIKNGELHVVWKPKGKSMLRTRMKSDPNYIQDSISVFKEAYKRYVSKLK